MLRERGASTRESWPQLLAQRVELLQMTTSAERTAEDEPAYIDYLFEVLLNDPNSTRFRLPVRVTADEAIRPGYFDDPQAENLSPNYHFKAWYALCRFARALSELVNEVAVDGVNTPYSRWASDVQTW